jgi:hypothetical protein
MASRCRPGHPPSIARAGRRDRWRYLSLLQLSTADERTALFAWFGIAATGGEVVAGPNGETLPEYAVVDRAKFDRALADPYGYLRNLSGTTTTQRLEWGRVKQLYR